MFFELKTNGSERLKAVEQMGNKRCNVAVTGKPFQVNMSLTKSATN